MNFFNKLKKKVLLNHSYQSTKYLTKNYTFGAMTFVAMFVNQIGKEPPGSD